MAPSGPSEYKEAGNNFFKLQKWKEAEEQYTLGIACPELATDARGLLLSNRSQCWINLGEFQRAFDDANACVKLLPEHVKSLFRRATAAEQLGKEAEALADYVRVAKADPKNTAAVSAAKRLRDNVLRTGAQKMDDVLPANLMQKLRDDSTSVDERVDVCRKMQALCVHRSLTNSLISQGALQLLVDITSGDTVPQELQEASIAALLTMASGTEAEETDEELRQKESNAPSSGPLPVPDGAANARKRLHELLDLGILRRVCKGRAKAISRLALIVGLVYEPEDADVLETIHDAIAFTEGGDVNVAKSGIIGLTTMLDTRWRLGKQGKPLMAPAVLLKCFESALGTTTCQKPLESLMPRAFALLADDDRPDKLKLDLGEICQKMLEPFLQSQDISLKANGLVALEALYAAKEKAATNLLHSSPIPLTAIISMVSRPPDEPEGRRAQAHAAECMLLAMGSKKTREHLIQGGGVEMLLSSLADGQEGSTSKGTLRAKLVNVLAMLAGHNAEIREEIFDRLDFLMELRFALEAARENSQAVKDKGKSATKSDREEARRLCRGLYESCVCLSIHAEFKELLSKAKNTMKAMLNLATPEDLAEDGHIAFLYSTLVYNLCRSREDKVRGKSDNSMLNDLGADDLKALEEFYEKMPAESRPETNGEVDAGSKELADEIRSWCVQSSGASKGQSSLVVASLGKCLVGGSVRAKNLAAMSLKFLCENKEHRRIVSSSGGVRACLNLVDLEEETAKDAARQVLAQILIGTNPMLLSYKDQLDSVRPLIDTLGHKHELLQFEAAMALTNLLSASDELRSRAIQGQAWFACRDLVFGENEQVQRAGLEAMCNMTMAPEILERFAEGKGDDDLKIFAAFSLSEDMPTQVAVTGALAMLAAYEEIVARIAKLENYGNLLDLIAEAKNGDIEHRVASILCSICAAPDVSTEVVRSTKDVLRKRLVKGHGLASSEAKELIQACLNSPGGA